MGCQEGRVSTNLSDNRPSQIYAQSPYSQIPIEIDYFYLSAFFPTAKSSNGESGESGEGGESGKSGENGENGESGESGENGENGENASSNEVAEVVQEGEGEKWKEVVFPRLYAGSLSSFNRLIPYLSTFTDITMKSPSPSSSPSSSSSPSPSPSSPSPSSTTTTLEMVFADVDNKADYRCVLAMTGVSGYTNDIQQRYHCGEETTRGKLGKCMKDRLFCQADISLLKEDDGNGNGNGSGSMHARVWGKGKKSISSGGSGSENGVLKLTDCMELKKTTTVMLSNKR